MGERKIKTFGGLRENARLYAVQALYSADFQDDDILQIAETMVSEGSIHLGSDITTDAFDRQFFLSLIKSYSAHVDTTDKYIVENLSKKWSVERIDKVARSILRLGATELLYMDTPANVIFNEYVEIAKAFFNGKSESAFINGVLNTIHEKHNRITCNI